MGTGKYMSIGHVYGAQPQVCLQAKKKVDAWALV